MSGFFQSEIEELKKNLNIIINFVALNNKNIKSTEYYISLGTKNLLQVIEETLSDPTINEDQKKENLNLMESFLEKLKDIDLRLSSSNEPESIEIKKKLEEGTKLFGFSGNNNIFSELENTLKRLDKKEVLL